MAADRPCIQGLTTPALIIVVLACGLQPMPGPGMDAASSRATAARAESIGFQDSPLADAGPGKMLIAHRGQEWLLLDPATGALIERVRGDTAVAATGGVLFTSSSMPDGRLTEVRATRVGSALSEPVTEILGQAWIVALSPNGRRLYLVRHDAEDTVTGVDLPERWQSRPAVQGETTGSLQVASPDGHWLYRVGRRLEEQPWPLSILPAWLRPAPGFRPTIRFVELERGVEPGLVREIVLDTKYHYPSLLVSPDGATLYAVEHLGATNYVTDVRQRKVVRSGAIRGNGTKRSPCAAAPGPTGDRLYVIGGDRSGYDGIDVVDPTTLDRVAHILPEGEFQCLAADPDGTRLYASTLRGRSVVTIDARTGTKLREVPVAAGEARQPLLLILAWNVR